VSFWITNSTRLLAPLSTAVTSVPRVISMLPSPFRQTTLRSGRASAIPTARSAACPMALSAEAKSSGWVEWRAQGRTIPMVVTTTSSRRQAASGASAWSLVITRCLR
jgi:hypothetical protein